MTTDAVCQWPLFCLYPPTIHLAHIPSSVNTERSESEIQEDDRETALGLRG